MESHKLKIVTLQKFKWQNDKTLNKLEEATNTNLYIETFYYIIFCCAISRNHNFLQALVIINKIISIIICNS